MTFWIFFCSQHTNMMIKHQRGMPWIEAKLKTTQTANLKQNPRVLMVSGHQTPMTVFIFYKYWNLGLLCGRIGKLLGGSDGFKTCHFKNYQLVRVKTGYRQNRVGLKWVNLEKKNLNSLTRYVFFWWLVAVMGTTTRWRWRYIGGCNIGVA